MAVFLLALSASLFLVTGNTDLDDPQQDDWLVRWSPQAVSLTEGTTPDGKTATVTLSNGLISRVFAVPMSTPPAPTPPACTCGSNPGGRVVPRTDGTSYPYYGLQCGATSDCGQCSLDNKCTCEMCSKGATLQRCCAPHDAKSAHSTPPAFATIGLSRVGHAGRDGGDMQMLRAIAPEAVVTLDGTEYSIGGLIGQADCAFLNTTLLPSMGLDPKAFVYKTRRTRAPTARYPWTPGQRHSDATIAWPPQGLTLEVEFVAPALAVAAHRDVTVTVHYEMYAELPAYAKWVTVSNAGNSSVMVTALTTDLFHATPEVMSHGWPHVFAGSITAGSTTGRMHMESEMTRGGDTTFLEHDARCNTCTQGNGELVLRSAYPLGPGAQIGPSGFHGKNFSSFWTYTLLHDSDDWERQGLAIRRMYRLLAPQITENPYFMHLTNATAAGIRAAVDQCAEVGFEMIILSFGSGLRMESTDETYIESVAQSVTYAHSKGIEIGGYNLMSSSRHVSQDADCLGPDGKPDGATCLASQWSDDYFTTIKNFISKTGFDMIETDGPFEGAKCSSHNHSHHLGEEDSVWTQYERNMDFYAWCRARGMYIHAPDPYYMRGINKDGMGYVETNWNLPLWEQITLARQNVYDGTWTKIPSQGWMFVPLVQYHGGWPECCIEPVGFLAGQWEWYLAMYFGTGVSPCYRGYRLYDEALPATKTLVKKWVDWANTYRTILHADMIHIKRPDGNGIDAMLHVEADAKKCTERALLMVFNPNPGTHVNTSLVVPLYYSGLADVASVSQNGVGVQQYTLRRDWTIQLPIVMTPNSFAWYVISAPTSQYI